MGKKKVNNGGLNKRGAKLATDSAVNAESRTMRNCKDAPPKIVKEHQKKGK
jgi:hypothetical protein